MNMINRSISIVVVALVIALSLSFPVDAASVKFVKSFDSGSDDFFFQRLHGVVMSKNKDIYVVDGKGNFIARYNWNGKLIKKIGQRGQGSGDFNFPSNVALIENKLLFIDRLNSRIAETDLELNDLKYYKYHSGELFSGDFQIIDKSKCLGYALSYSIDFNKEYKAIKILDFKSQAEEMFFDKMPVKNLKTEKLFNKAVLFMIVKPCIGIDRKNEKILVSFTYPNNPIEFFEYSYNGECLDQFSYVFDKSYKYPKHFLTGAKHPEKYKANLMMSIFQYKGHYLVLVSKVSYMKGSVDEELYCLVFDAKSKNLKHKIPIPKFLKFYSVSEDGYLLGTRYFQDDVNVYVYKIEL